MPATAVADAVADCKAIVDFAAETHVDRSISGAREFATTNMQGTEVLLEAARAKRRRYLEVSTDEVYGSIESGSFSESSPPSSQRDEGERRPTGIELRTQLRA